MKRWMGVAGALVALAIVGNANAAGTAPHRMMTLDGARAVADAAAAEAHRLGAGGAIAVTDDGGHLLVLLRLDDTFPAASDVATEKARTAATFRRATRVFEDAIRNGRTSLVAVDVMTPLQGGVPIVVDGVVLGAIGVSGAMSAQQDEDIANVAAGMAQKLLTSGDDVSYLPAPDVKAAFAKGQPLIENGHYKIHASRRTAPGQAEVHTRDTDIIHVLEGEATFVTGGEVVDGKTTGPEEVRGASIRGGKTRKLVPGDVMVVPAGTPHWFKEVHGTFLYYVVKTT